jgi:Protein of unknown function DUF45
VSAEIYQIYESFMVGYVRRINAATLNVTIGGVRIGNAKYSRLAQINLQSRIITFSRYAIENVPERARRYLVIHELAHVLEPSHNQRFWAIVARHEPDYKLIDKQLTIIFNENVRKAVESGRIQEGSIAYLTGDRLKLEEEAGSDVLIAGSAEDEFGNWLEGNHDPGIVCGGS